MANLTYRIRSTGSDGTGAAFVDVKLVDLGDGTYGLATAAGATGSSSDQVQGTAASGAAGVGNPVSVAGRVGGSGNVQSLYTDSSGKLAIIGPVATGAAAGTTVPVLVGGVDGSGTAQILINDASGQVNQPHALSANRWSYAAASGGISNTTTAVTVKTAAGASVRNYVTSMQIEATALGAATEIAIRDGAAGTVLWRSQISTTGLLGGLSIVFPTPLKGTANTLLEVVTLTASVTGAVYFNLQGYTAA